MDNDPQPAVDFAELTANFPVSVVSRLGLTLKSDGALEHYLNKIGMIAHGPENIFYRERRNLRLGGAIPRGADLYGLASRHRGLVGTDVVQLDWPRRCRWPRFFGV